MRIDIDDKYCITADDNNYILNIKRIAEGGKHKGKEVLDVVSYHGLIESALAKWASRDTKASGVTNIPDLIARIEHQEKVITNLLSNEVA